MNSKSASLSPVKKPTILAESPQRHRRRSYSDSEPTKTKMASSAEPERPSDETKAKQPPEEEVLSYSPKNLTVRLQRQSLAHNFGSSPKKSSSAEDRRSEEEEREPSPVAPRLTRKRKDELETFADTPPSSAAVEEGKTPPKRTKIRSESHFPPCAELWREYGLFRVPCKLGNCSSRSKCKNVYCLNRLGHDKWDGLLTRYKNKVDKEYPGRNLETEPAGLKNLGNTCYLNSYLQVWFHLIPFRQAVYNWQKLPEGFWAVPRDGSMDAEETMLALQHLFISLEGAPFESFSPKRIVNALKLNADQQDALEFGQLFLSMLKETVSSHKNGCQMAQMLKDQFEGMCSQVTECGKCHRKSRNATPFTELTLSIQEHKNVGSALAAYFSEEALEWRCGGTCTGNFGTKKMQLSRIPPILVLQLNRFVYDRTSQRKRKLQQPLSFTRVLDLTPFMVEGAGNQTEYELAAILVHQGNSAYMGHYYALIEDQNRGKWFKFNDEEVTELTGKRIPGTEEGDGKAANTQEAKGAYMLVYRIKAKRGEAKEECKMPEHCGTVLGNLLEHYWRAREEFHSIVERKIERAEQKTERMKELWKELQVPTVNREEQIAFFPLDILSSLQSKEVEDLGLKKEGGLDPVDECKIVDVPEEICNGGDRDQKHKDKQTQIEDRQKGSEGEDPMDSLEKGLSGRSPTPQKMNVGIEPDKPVELKMNLDGLRCAHGKLPLKAVKEGKWRAVKAEGALRLMEAHCPNRNVPILSGQDLCDRCVDDELAGEKFRERLEKVADDVTDALRKTNPSMTPSSLPACLRKEFYWVSKKDINRFRALASEYGSRSGGQNIHNGSADDESDSAEMDQSNRAGPSEDLKDGGGTYVFNADLICEHGCFSCQRKCRRLVELRIWKAVKQYFPNAKEFYSEQPECVMCSAEEEGNEKELQKMSDLATYYCRNLDLLKKEGTVNRTIDNINTDIEDTFYVLCREYFDNWLEFLKNPRVYEANGCKRICNDCLLCDHGRLKFPLEASQYISGPMSSVFPSTVTSSGRLDSRKPFVILSSDEWGKLCYPECGEEFFVEVDTDVTVKIERDGSAVVTPGNCDECFARMLSDKEGEKFNYELGKIYVQKMEVDRESTDQAKPDGASIIPGIFNLRRSTRRTRPKDSTDYIVDSTDTIQSLKLKIMTEENAAPVDQHLYYEGEELSDLNKTLFHYKIPNGATLKIRIDTPLPEEEVMAQAERERARSPERGFQGSVLTQRK